MAAIIGLDCALLCGEDDTTVIGDRVPAGCQHPGSLPRRRDFPDDEPVFPAQSDECLMELVEKERRHLPKCEYLGRLRSGDLDLEARMEAIDWMLKVQSHYRFGPLCAYLSVNYLDRFLSAYDLPKGKAWMTQLLAVACLSLAAKMEENEVPLSLDLQVSGSRFVFEARTIQRMELLILSTLSWRMQSVSPFSFIDHFLWKICGDNISTTEALISRSVQVILSSLKAVELLDFKPSEVAAAVAICVAVEAQLAQTEEAISALTPFIAKERVAKCMEVMYESTLISDELANKGINSVSSSVPQSPIGDLEASCFSYSSSQNNTPESNKKRKIDR